MERKFKTGDRVVTKPNTWISHCLTYGIVYVGTVIGYDDRDDDFILVKFDNFTDGHDGNDYYLSKDMKYDPNNRQHLYVLEEKLYLLEGEDER